jgi:putative membrane protein
MMNRFRQGTLVSGLFVALAWSAINPHDRFTWFLEVLPVFIGAIVLAATYRRFPLTSLAYALLAIHAVILLVGGHYTYAEVPLFNWIRDAFGLARNDYDRLGHFVQGFVPAIIAREVLLRRSPLKPGKWLFFIVVCICLAISASYELFEWSVAELTGTAADSFLGTQGDPWDTQKDMAMALIGAPTALLLLSGLHDNALQRIGRSTHTE